MLGKNGMGKSTLLKTVMGFLPMQGGSVQLFGQSTAGLPPHRIARKAIAYTPQEQALFQDLTVEENLRLSLRDQVAFDAGSSVSASSSVPADAPQTARRYAVGRRAEDAAGRAGARRARS